ncbi:MAG: MBL fold metallo-hydrolase [Candidatus Aminicenantes bacterium]|nr:MBL fold metallo-hydrolase [Candidatus Aminicenantes bacterium]
MPRYNHHTAAYRVEGYGLELILDAGTGLCRLADLPGENAAELPPALILLSHYHLDHTAGLIYLSALFPRRRIIVAAPGTAVYGESAAAILNRLIAPPFFAHSLNQANPDLEVVDLAPGENHIAGLRIQCRIQTHTNPSMGIRIGNELAYITDTGCDAATVEFISGCPLLMHECWGRGEAIAASGHAHLEGVIQIARQAGVDQLLLVHINPLLTKSEINELEAAAQREFPDSAVARDLVAWPMAPGQEKLNLTPLFKSQARNPKQIQIAKIQMTETKARQKQSRNTRKKPS